jgi:hypothetical protein
MWDKQAYTEYLSLSRKNNGTIAEYLNILDHFHGYIAERKGANHAESELAIAESFLESYNTEHMYTVFKSVMQCLREYSDYLIKGDKDSSIVAAIRDALANRYKKKAADFAVSRKRLILPIPYGAVVEQKYLSNLDNDEFVKTFRELQDIIIAIYDDIEASPFEWGYPDAEVSYGYYHRAIDFLFAFVRNGEFDGTQVTVDAKSFADDSDIKKHKKRDSVVRGLQNCGFAIDNFGAKNTTFTVAYPDNDNVLRVLCAYVRALCDTDFTWITGEKYPCYWTLSRHKYSFSYRFIEQCDIQRHALPFLVELDYSTDKGKEALQFVHDEAARHGFTIDEKKPLSQMFHNSVIFKNGTNHPLYIGENQIQFWHGGTFYRGITMGVYLKKTFTSDKAATDALVSRHPAAFAKSQEFMRTRTNYQGEWFWFEDLELNDVKEIFTLYIRENQS